MNMQPPLDKVLFIGTDEQTAKSAPVKGIDPPVFLTDVYPTFSCPRDVEKWGIISINLKYLNTLPAPYPHNSKSKWNKTLENYGICTFHTRIPANAIERVMTYTPYGKYGNSLITELLLGQLDPRTITPKEHKSNYNKNLCLTNWLNSQEVVVEDFEPFFNDAKVLESFRDKIHNKSGLDIYYIRAEDKKKRKS